MLNSAGRTKREPTIDLSEEDWNLILETNLTGTLRACQIFGRHMIGNGYGRIINIASLSTFVSLFEVAAYSASKAAVASLTKSLAIEWAKHGVNVNAIAPGVFKTALNQKLLEETDRGKEFLTRTPMGRFGKVEELAGAAVFLASDAASFVTAADLSQTRGASQTFKRGTRIYPIRPGRTGGPHSVETSFPSPADGHLLSASL